MNATLRHRHRASFRIHSLGLSRRIEGENEVGCSRRLSGRSEDEFRVVCIALSQPNAAPMFSTA